MFHLLRLVTEKEAITMQLAYFLMFWYYVAMLNVTEKKKNAVSIFKILHQHLRDQSFRDSAAATVLINICL